MKVFQKILLYSLFFPLCMWPLLDLGAKQGNVPLSWLLKLLDLPIVLFWYLPHALGVDVYIFDFWTRRYHHPFYPGAFYAHLYSGCIAYLATLCVLLLLWRLLKRRSLAKPGLLNPQGSTVGSFLRQNGRIAEAVHGFTAAATVPLLIWCLYSRPIAYDTYLIVMSVMRLLDFPIAAVGLLLPPALRGLDLWFGLNPAFEDLASLFLPHMVLGTAIYLPMIFLLRVAVRRVLCSGR